MTIQPLQLQRGTGESTAETDDFSSTQADDTTITPRTDEEKAEGDGYETVPDGGFAAWLVVFGCACGGFSTFGFMNAFGVFQSSYQGRIPGATQATIAWVGSLQYCLFFLPGILSGHLVDRGWLRLPLTLGSLGLVSATFLIAQCSQLWQLILCQGVLLGVSAAFTFLPSLAVIPTWFDGKRGRAYGVVSLGSSVGGTVLPIVLRKLADEVGFAWSIRVVAFILLLCMVVFAMTLYCAGRSFIWLGLYTPLAFLDVSTQRLGVPAPRSIYTIVAANAASGIGRLLSGFLADAFGSMNMLIVVAFMAGMTCFVWPYAQTYTSVLVVSAIYGMTSGAFLSLMVSAISRMVPEKQMGRAMGLSWSLMSIGALVGNPIAGCIVTASSGFEAVGFYSGAAVLVSVGLLVASRRMALGGWLGKY